MTRSFRLRPKGYVGQAGGQAGRFAHGENAKCNAGRTAIRKEYIVFRENMGLFITETQARLKVAEIVRFSDISLIGKEIVNPWLEEYRRIWAVAQNPTGSSTSELLADENEICKKIGEESAEFVRAFVQGDGVPQEYNGVVYALMVAAAKLGVPWQEIESDLKSRWK